jgi:6-phosphofructokinase 1
VARRIGILTGGGDAPGLNAAIRAAAKTLILRGASVLGILDGFEGLVHGRGRELTFDDVSGILARGGTILGTANRGDAPVRMDEAVRRFRRWRLDAVLVLGGEGTQQLAHAFEKRGGRAIGVPKTIDNDLPATDLSFGFDTAVSVAAGALDALHGTADAHGRIMVMEVMGRRAGWIALYAGVAGGADVILIPEIPHDLERVAAFVRRRHRRRRFTLVSLAEGAGSAPDLARWLESATGIEARPVVLGHLQRGGPPTAFDRLLATRFGHAAADLAWAGRHGVMVALRGGRLVAVPLARAARGPRLVPRDHPLVRTAEALGVSFGR